MSYSIMYLSKSPYLRSACDVHSNRSKCKLCRRETKTAAPRSREWNRCITCRRETKAATQGVAISNYTGKTVNDIRTCSKVQRMEPMEQVPKGEIIYTRLPDFTGLNYRLCSSHRLTQLPNANSKDQP